MRLTIDSTDDREAAIAALGALFGVRLAVVADDAVGDTTEPATAGAPAAAAAGTPRRRGAKSNPGRAASTATRGGRRQSARKATPSPAARSAGKPAADDAAASSSSTATNAEIRSWAQRQGIAVASRGRIAASLVDAYRAANPV